MIDRRLAMLLLGLVVLAVGLGVGLPKLAAGDHDEYGRITIPPGKGSVELPAGEVVVFYEEGRSIAVDAAIDEPQIEWTIGPEDGEPLGLDGDGGRESNVTSDRAWTDFEAIDVPAAGTYEVEIGEITTPGAEPAITFGSSEAGGPALALVIGGALIGSVLVTLALVSGRGRHTDDG